MDGKRVNDRQMNWAGNYEYKARKFRFPESVEELSHIAKDAVRLKVLGSRHSFNDIAGTQGDLISLERLQPEITLDRQRDTVTVSGNIKYGELCQSLHTAGYALHNLASLPHISIAGACATATHGSGVSNGNLATAVSAMEIVNGSGELISLSREKHSQQFQGAVVALGGLGIMTRITLDVVPAYQMRQVVYEDLPLWRLEEHFQEIMSSAYGVSLFTDWQTDEIDQIWVKWRVSERDSDKLSPALFESKQAQIPLHPIRNHAADSCTTQEGVPGPWYRRLPHFRPDFTPSSGEELQSEYFVSVRHAFPAIMAISRLREHLASQLLVSEVRTVAADSLWMSPCYRQDCVAIHFTWKRNWLAVREILPKIEAALLPFDPRPHWGKLFTLPPKQVQKSYKKLADFRLLLQNYDPEGKFRNAFLDTYVFDTGDSRNGPA